MYTIFDFVAYNICDAEGTYVLITFRHGSTAELSSFLSLSLMFFFLSQFKWNFVSHITRCPIENHLFKAIY